MSENRPNISIQIHAAKDTGGRIIWAEVFADGHPVRSLADLQQLTGRKARLRWILHTPAGREQVSTDDPRIEQDGFLLRLNEADIRSDIQAECLVVA